MMATFNWFPGHMNKTLKNISNKMKVVDLIIEIVDARAPEASSNPILYKIIGSKPVVKLLSKSDLADPEITKKWISWYQKNNINASLLNYQQPHFSKKIIEIINQTLQLKISRWKEKGLLQPQVNVLVVGIPNVGKSTFINQLSKRHKTIVANRPGVTRGLQIIQLSPIINVIDSPGVLPPKLDSWETAIKLVAINAIKKGIYPVGDVGHSLVENLYQQYPNYWIREYNLKDSIASKNIAQYIFQQMAMNKKYQLTNEFDWDSKVIEPFIEDLANGKFHFSFEYPK